jgi:hypothetical protein
MWLESFGDVRAFLICGAGKQRPYARMTTALFHFQAGTIAALPTVLAAIQSSFILGLTTFSGLK